MFAFVVSSCHCEGPLFVLFVLFQSRLNKGGGNPIWLGTLFKRIPEAICNLLKPPRSIQNLNFTKTVVPLILHQVHSFWLRNILFLNLLLKEVAHLTLEWRIQVETFKPM